MSRRAAELTIGALAKSTGVKVETIRYYERIGLMPAPRRSAGGQRSYERAHLQRLAFIRRSRALGFPLDEVRALLKQIDGGSVSCGEIREMTLRHLQAIRAKLADLQRVERALAGTAARCNGAAAPECPIIDALCEDKG